MSDARPLSRQSASRYPAEATAEERLRIVECERDRLRASLERYGAHQDGCAARALHLSIRCTCGYHAALGEVRGCMGAVRHPSPTCNRCPHTRHTGICASANGEDNGSGCQCPGTAR